MSQSLFFFDRSSSAAVEVSGAEAVDFLNRISSQDIKSMPLHSSAPGAFLNANGSVVCLFLIIKLEDKVILLSEPQSTDRILKYIDKMHFGEKIQFQKNNQWKWLEVRGVGAKDKFQEVLSLETSALEKQWPAPVLSVNSDLMCLRSEPWALPGYLLGATEDQFQMLKERFANEGRWISGAEHDSLRALHFFPKDQVDIGDANIILESGLYDYVHRNKGCYPGQEVVERLHTYGNVAKKLVQLSCPTGAHIDTAAEIYRGGKKVGLVSSVVKDFCSDQSLSLMGTVQRVEVRPEELYEIRNPHTGIILTEARLIKAAPDVPKN